MLQTRDHQGAKAQPGLPRAALHELRTPLTSIRGYAQLLLRGARDEQTRLRAYATIEREATRLASMLDQVARLNHNRRELVPGRVDLGTGLRDAMDASAAAWPEHRLELEQAEPLAVLADGSSLDEILRALLENAATYSEPGSPVVVRVERVGDQAAIHVVDEGIGVPAEERERLFEPFFRASNAGMLGARGLGLSLHLARRAAESQGGSLELMDDQPSGCHFVLRLPLVE